MDSSKFIFDNPTSPISNSSAKFVCPRHQGEKLIRVCMNINCDKPGLLCGGCLLNDPEHCIAHKNDIKIIKDFIEIAENSFNTLKNRNYKPSEISSDLLDFLNESENINERLAKKFYEDAQNLDIQFEEIIKEFTENCITTKDDIKSRMKKNYEKLSENYKFVFDKIKYSYNILEQDELLTIYPNKEKIYSQLYNSISFVESETLVKKIRYDIYEIVDSHLKNKKTQLNKKVEIKNQLTTLSKFVKDQISSYQGFYFETGIKQCDPEEFQENYLIKIEEFFKSIKTLVKLPEVEPCTSLPKGNSFYF